MSRIPGVCPAAHSGGGSAPPSLPGRAPSGSAPPSLPGRAPSPSASPSGRFSTPPDLLRRGEVTPPTMPPRPQATPPGRLLQTTPPSRMLPVTPPGAMIIPVGRQIHALRGTPPPGAAQNHAQNHENGPTRDNQDGERTTPYSNAAPYSTGSNTPYSVVSPLQVVAGRGGARMYSRNLNGTLCMTGQPTNESELQLYRVLQRANLLNYYDTFINQGGDDVQQLCEAGEEEFLEIMALVGMASKPLHVRRLQKALQEWVQNPGLFQTPLVSSLSGFPTAAAAAAVIRAGAVLPAVSSHSHLPSSHASSAPPTSSTPTLPQLLARPLPSSAASPPGAHASQPPRPPSTHSPSPSSKDLSLASRLRPDTLRDSDSRERERETGPPSPTFSQSSRIPGGGAGLVAGANLTSGGGGVAPNNGGANRPPPLSWDTTEDSYFNSGEYPGPPTSPLQLTPVLVESQIQRISDTAAALVKALPDLEPKQPNTKKKICKELDYVMNMSDEDPRKMEDIRKFSAIYGRFDCKRKPEKPLTLHEVSVNEAAAQICRLVPAMLTRRDELFPLARQVVRDSGYQYSKGHSRSTFQMANKLFNGEEGPFKRMRFSEDSEMTQRRRERIDQIVEEARVIAERLEELRTAAGAARVAGDINSLQHIGQQVELYQGKQGQLIQERDDHQRIIKFSSRMSTCSDPDRPDTDDDNSQRSYSNASSPGPSLQGPPNYVLSASGGQIIAVQNPALSMSGLTTGAPSSPPSRHHHHNHSPPSGARLMQDGERPTSISSLISMSRAGASSPPRTSPVMKQEPSSPQALSRD